MHSAALSLVATSRSLDDHAASKRPSLAGPASGRGLAPPVIMTPAAGPTGRDPAGPSCSPAGGGPAPRPFAGHCQPECRGRRRARPPREGGCQFLRFRPLAIGTPALISSRAPRVPGIPASQPENRGPSRETALRVALSSGAVGPSTCHVTSLKHFGITGIAYL